MYKNVTEEDMQLARAKRAIIEQLGGITVITPEIIHIEEEQERDLEYLVSAEDEILGVIESMDEPRLKRALQCSYEGCKNKYSVREVASMLILDHKMKELGIPLGDDHSCPAHCLEHYGVTNEYIDRLRKEAVKLEQITALDLRTRGIAVVDKRENPLRQRNGYVVVGADRLNPESRVLFNGDPLAEEREGDGSEQETLGLDLTVQRLSSGHVGTRSYDGTLPPIDDDYSIIPGRKRGIALPPSFKTRDPDDLMIEEE